MKILGIVIIAFGLVDLVGSYIDFDLWGGFLGVQLPDIVWKYSSFIEIGLGYFIMTLAPKNKNETEPTESDS